MLTHSHHVTDTYLRYDGTVPAGELAEARRLDDEHRAFLRANPERAYFEYVSQMEEAMDRAQREAGAIEECLSSSDPDERGRYTFKLPSGDSVRDYPERLKERRVRALEGAANAASALAKLHAEEAQRVAVAA